MKLTTFALLLQMSSQLSFSFRPSLTSAPCDEEAMGSGRTGLPDASKPKISSPTDEVRPDSISCLCLQSESQCDGQSSVRGDFKRASREESDAPEQCHSRLTSSVVEPTPRQHTQSGRLARVDIADDRYAKLVQVFERRSGQSEQGGVGGRGRRRRQQRKDLSRDQRSMPSVSISRKKDTRNRLCDGREAMYLSVQVLHRLPQDLLYRHKVHIVN